MKCNHVGMVASGKRRGARARRWVVTALAGVTALWATALAVATNIGAALVPSGWVWARNGIVVWTAVGLLTVCGATLTVLRQRITGHAEGGVDGESRSPMLVKTTVSRMTGGVVIGTNAGQVFTGPVTLTSG